MNMMQELKALGVNTDEGILRMNGNVSLYERMLFKFADMMKNLSVLLDFDCDNYDEIIDVAHTIKGTSGNLSVTPVYDAYSEIVRLLRAGEPEQAKKILEQVLPVQADILKCIEKNS